MAAKGLTPALPASSASVESSIIHAQLEALRAAARERRSVCEELNKVVKSLANSKDYAEGGSEGARKLTERVRRVRRKLGDCAGAERGALLKLHDRLYYLDGKEVVRPSCRVEGNEGPTDTGAEGEGTSGLLPHGSEVRAISPGRARRMRMDRFLVDHMARSGYHESAAAIANVSKVSNLVDSSTFRDAQRIIDDLRKRKTASALEWCNRNRARLKKIGSRLEFCLRCQDLVEMAREASELQKFDAKDMGLGGPGAESSGGLSSATAAAARGASNAKKIEAVEYARRYLSPFAQCEGQRLQETMATLVFGPDTSIQKYRRLYSSTQWTDLQTQMVTDLCRINGLPTTSYMNVYLQAGLSSLKTHTCGTESSSLEDPMHLPEFRLLAEPLPFAKHNNSKLICFVTQTRIDEDNPAMVLPNGYVYSKRGVEELVARNDAGQFFCPRTGDGPYDEKKDVVKAFIL